MDYQLGLDMECTDDRIKEHFAVEKIEHEDDDDESANVIPTPASPLNVDNALFDLSKQYEDEKVFEEMLRHNIDEIGKKVVEKYLHFNSNFITFGANAKVPISSLLVRQKLEGLIQCSLYNKRDLIGRIMGELVAIPSPGWENCYPYFDDDNPVQIFVCGELQAEDPFCQFKCAKPEQFKAHVRRTHTFREKNFKCSQVSLTIFFLETILPYLLYHKNCELKSISY